MSAGLGNTREEVLRNISLGGTRTLAKAAEATESGERAQRFVREYPDAGMSHIADHATRTAQKAQQAAYSVSTKIRYLDESLSLDQLREIERQILRLETLADASARGAAFYAGQISTTRWDGNIPTQGPTASRITE
ncbi:hypothetical protein ACIF8W_28575 [Streptomyces sp. NPDC085639]|uniref:hypothetical protein n=1 Tax=Streptomyces sp. NPDC085639 TaxID=3365734 RepID=UPI0037CFCE8C